MSQISYKQPFLLQPKVWFMLYALTFAGLALNHFWQQWANEYRNKVTADLQPYSIQAGYILGFASRSWLPWPWQADKTTLKDNIIAVENSIQSRLTEFLSSKPLGIPWHRFSAYVLTWDVGNKMCRLVQSFFQESELCQPSDQLSKAWIDYFNNHFDQSYYISYVDDHPVFGERQSHEVAYCNTSPLTVESAVLEHLASPELSAFYQTAMLRTQKPFQHTETDAVMPGDCRSLEVKSYDVPLEAAFHIVPQNPEMERWFFQNWKTYHATWLNNPEQYEALVNITRQNIATTICNTREERGIVDNGFSFDRLGEDNCDKANLETYLYGIQLSKPDQLFYAANYPGFSGYEQYVNPDGTLNQEILNSVLKQAKDFAPLVKQQFLLAQKWDSTIPRFELGASLYDSSGPFEVGVDATQIPQTTILDDFIEIPEVGMIYEVNGRTIYSAADIHEALSLHGDDKGIMSPISVSIYNESAELPDGQYTTRFRFNPKAQQNFDTNVGFLELSSYGLLLNSTALNCKLKNIFRGLGETDHCAWVDDQRFAYAKQITPEKFNFSTSAGQIAGLIFAPEMAFKSFRLFSGAGRLSTLNRVILGGAAEALPMAAYANSELPQSLAAEERLALTIDAAKNGFAWGSAFALIR